MLASQLPIFISSLNERERPTTNEGIGESIANDKHSRETFSFNFKLHDDISKDKIKGLPKGEWAYGANRHFSKGDHRDRRGRRMRWRERGRRSGNPRESRSCVQTN